MNRKIKTNIKYTLLVINYRMNRKIKTNIKYTLLVISLYGQRVVNDVEDVLSGGVYLQQTGIN